MMHTVSTEINGVQFSLETGRFAKLADGAVMVRQGDTMVLVTAVASSEPSPMDFLPLTVEYREKSAAAGKIPGGFFKREARPSEKEILSARLIDRPLRPMFPKYWRKETQVIATIFSSDQEHDADTLAMVGASAALLISSIPFEEAVSEVRVAKVNGEFVLNPRFSQLESAILELTVAGTDDSIVMVEGSSKEISEDDFVEAMAFAHDGIRKLNALQRELQALVPKEKQEVPSKEYPAELVEFVQAESGALIHEQVRETSSKEVRGARRKTLMEELATKAAERFTPESHPEWDFAGLSKMMSEILKDVEKKAMREMILSEDKRLDGRSSTQIRPITIETGLLPRTHGSALFTRGETQSLTSITLGTKLDEQMIDGLMPRTTRKFMLHYNFPPFSTNEVKRVMGTSRREIGHGNLASLAIESLLPNPDDFPYTTRVLSDILESNGSSSMATVCAGSLALFDAGVPLKKAVSGIAMGLIKEDDRVAILSDILGDEDFLGDMDFKVCGTADGITACQMDMKIKGISLDVVKRALEQARAGRMHILGLMNEAISEPRADLSPYAPRFTVIQIPVEMIGAVIGTGGETIRNIVKESGAEVNIEEDGRVIIAATSQESADKASAMVKALTRVPAVGEVYNALVKEVREGLGCFVEYLPKKQGLVHISQLDVHRVANVSDVVKVGERIDVKLIEIQPDGKVRLSRRVLLPGGEQSNEGGGGHHHRSGGDDRRRDDHRGGDRRRDDDRRHDGGDRRRH